MSSAMIKHCIAQACGAINDNIIRNTATFMLFAGIIHSEHKSTDAALFGLTFILPFVLFAPTAGCCSDRWPRHLIMRAVRLAEPLLLIFGFIALTLQSTGMIMASLALLGMQSAFFAPVKLACIPQLVRPQHLPWANSLIQAATSISILLGISLAALADPALWKPFYETALIGDILSAWNLAPLAFVALAIAATGIITTFSIPKLKAANPKTKIRGPLAGISQLRTVFSDALIGVPALGAAAFWLLAPCFAVTLPALATNVFQLTVAEHALVSLVLAIGMASGAAITSSLFIAAYPAGLPMIGAAICAGFITLLANINNPEQSAIFWTAVFGCGVGGSFWIIPCNILLQQRSKEEERGRIFSAVSLLGSVGLLGGFATLAALPADLLPQTRLLGIASLMACILVLPIVRYRLSFIAWFVACLSRVIYKLRFRGTQHIPAKGGCLLVANHLSFADAPLLSLHLPRSAHFLAYAKFFKVPVVGAVMKASGAIPIAGDGGRKALIASIDAAVAAAQAGEMVVIFAEGGISSSGEITPFQRGLEKIAQRAEVPIIPIHIDGLYGDITSRAKKRSLPFRRRVDIRIGEALPYDTDAKLVETAVRNLSLINGPGKNMTLPQLFLKQYQANKNAKAISDRQGTLTREELAIAADMLRRKLGLNNYSEKNIGVLLPTGRAGAIANLAIAFAGKISANLNHTIGKDNFQATCETASIQTLITARKYIEHIKLEFDPSLKLIYLDDLLPQFGKFLKLTSFLRVRFLPHAWLTKHNDSQSCAALLFSSGSTGTPKGIQLSHANIAANGSAIKEHFNLSSGETNLCSPLPLFHSFGLGPGLWLGLTQGLHIIAHPDPRDGAAIGGLCRKHDADFLISTPTFVRGYMRRVESEDFAKLKFAIVGAEKCPDELKESFREKYDAELLEGYGCTECSPVLSAAVLDTPERNGSKSGSVGLCLPGIEMITVDPETHETLEKGKEGLLIARTPGRMMGYYNKPELTESVFIQGGYNTGDIGYVDEDGFVFLVGRLARFAKIGGEMVPLDNVERCLQAHLDEKNNDKSEDAAKPSAQTAEVAVCSIPDPQRGEKLIVLHTDTEADAADLIQASNELPPIFRPKKTDVYQVEKIPQLGTGKRDLAALKKLAESLAGK